MTMTPNEAVRLFLDRLEGGTDHAAVLEVIRNERARLAQEEARERGCHCGGDAWWVRDWRVRCNRCATWCRCDPDKVAAFDAAAHEAYEWAAIPAP